MSFLTLLPPPLRRYTKKEKAIREKAIKIMEAADAKEKEAGAKVKEEKKPKEEAGAKPKGGGAARKPDKPLVRI